MQALFTVIVFSGQILGWFESIVEEKFLHLWYLLFLVFLQLYMHIIFISPKISPWQKRNNSELRSDRKNR